MYSVVLMMALAGSADTPAFHRGGGCHGGGGCYGGGGSCYGGGYGGGCYGGGGGCHGKRGGGLFGGGLFRKGGRGCHGGGGCHGYSAGCCGSYGGGCTGGGYYGGGCTGGGYMGGCMGGAPAAMPAGTTPAKPEKVKAPKPEKGAVTPAPATILVSLPAEAKLTVDGTPTTSTSSTRLFVSPALEQGKEYVYTLQAQVTREGKPVSVSKRVTVHAGEETRVSFEVPVTSVAQK